MTDSAATGPDYDGRRDASESSAKRPDEAQGLASAGGDGTHGDLASPVAASAATDSGGGSMSGNRLSYYFGEGTRRHEANAINGTWASMWCGIAGRKSGPAQKVWSSRSAPNCKACAKSKALAAR